MGSPVSVQPEKYGNPHKHTEDVNINVKRHTDMSLDMKRKFSRGVRWQQGQHAFLLCPPCVKVCGHSTLTFMRDHLVPFAPMIPSTSQALMLGVQWCRTGFNLWL